MGTAGFDTAFAGWEAFVMVCVDDGVRTASLEGLDAEGSREYSAPDAAAAAVRRLGAGRAGRAEVGGGNAGCGSSKDMFSSAIVGDDGVVG